MSPALTTLESTINPVGLYQSEPSLNTPVVDTSINTGSNL